MISVAMFDVAGSIKIKGNDKDDSYELFINLNNIPSRTEALRIANRLNKIYSPFNMEYPKAFNGTIKVPFTISRVEA